MLLAGVEIPLWLILILPVSTLLYLYSIRTFNTFKKAGIPGPSPRPVVGTTLELYGMNMMAADTLLFEKYGKFVGTFEGTLPVLMVYDAEWLKEAFIKHFVVLTDRRKFKLGSSIDAGIFSIDGEHWKHSRKMLSPEFSSGKLKRMMPSIQKCVSTFVRKLRESNEEPVDIRRKTNLLTLDVISTTAFGIDSEAQTMEDNQYAKNAFLFTSSFEANSTLREKIRMGVMIFLALIAPTWLDSFIRKLFNVGLLDLGAVEYFEQLCDSIIEAKKKETGGHDFLQNLAGNLIEPEKGDKDTMVDSMGYRWSRKGITKVEAVGNALLFLLAGFQTTADTMLFIFYELAHHPEIQQQLYEEIMEVCDTEDVTIEQIQQLKYLEYCINESMRLYPQGFRFDRMVTEDITIRDIHLTKGTAVTASSWVIQRDPEIWENPEEFDPERFSPERFTSKCATAFMPFGIGNRQCIGNRLALIEMKMTIISALKNFKIEKNELTPSRPIQLKATLAITPEDTIMVSFVERSKA